LVVRLPKERGGFVDSKELMHLHVGALFIQDESGRLVTTNDPSGAPAPRFFLGSTAQGNIWWVRQDLPSDMVEELNILCQRLPSDIELTANAPLAAQLKEVLSRTGPVERMWSGPAYVCPTNSSSEGSAIWVTASNADLLSPYLCDWQADVAAGVPMAASLEDGVAVSVCCSVRVTATAHEAGVETHPNFRRRGNAGRAVFGWSAAVRELGCAPLYSTSWENTASRKLARHLGLDFFGTDLHLT
jgi:hypothetical protein